MSRIVTQDEQERGYHIMYQFLKGTDSNEKAKYKLQGPNSYKCVNPKCLDAPGINDLEDMKEVRVSFKSMGMNDQDMDGIFKCLSAVLNLSNVEVKGENREGVPDAAALSNKDLFGQCCEMLGVPTESALHAMLIKITNVGGKEIAGVYSASEAHIIKESMAKAIYNSLFNWIINKLNSNIKPPEGFSIFIGMLDIFGFEVFKNNSLEQLFINITNEMLQKNFVDVVFDRELKLYRSEGISSAELKWTTNAPIIELLTNKKKSLVSLLEDTCMAPGGDDKKFLTVAAQNLGQHPHFAKAKIASETNFIITHTIGDIQYCVLSFVAKNKDMLKAELVEVLQKSSNHVVAGLFAGVTVEKGKIGKDQLISAQFLGQLATLMELINSTEPHFVRCLKPNEDKAALKFTPSKVLIQLHALSILEALQLRNLGYSYRRPFSEFIQQFKFLDVGISEDKSLDPKDACQKLLTGAQLKSSDYQIGNTMVFLKHEATKYLTLRQRELMAAWSPLISVLEAMYKSYSVRRDLKKLLPALIRVQAHIRAHNVRKAA
eukprot:Protomagalhaensia_sp_Gyna_25__903@NODE_1435_length_1839_cov_9_251111_g1159_i0_p1_GENE_NODE_1435_length_1839_cov_9_251111_g1159_i0NODE_1435_length_1839_cov_9_251111_g1159_i0_p1_ORF_typecomplete_len589_score148_22Myosin_head/PF00063_21/6_2e150IQ/PF00612_27/1_7e03IQ/PF00612_27/1_6_NODE_1435_length_1839_cov_9_251111_g1159_i01311768